MRTCPHRLTTQQRCRGTYTTSYTNKYRTGCTRSYSSTFRKSDNRPYRNIDTKIRTTYTYHPDKISN